MTRQIIWYTTGKGADNVKSRDLYIERLPAYKDKESIKVITGMRRCGKSMLLELFKRRLHETGVPDQRIIHMNFESLRYDSIKDYIVLHKHIMEQVKPDDKSISCWMKSKKCRNGSGVSIRLG